jgi:hypothetical protein
MPVGSPAIERSERSLGQTLVLSANGLARPSDRFSLREPAYPPSSSEGSAEKGTV